MIIETDKIRIDVNDDYYSGMLSSQRDRSFTLPSGDVRTETAESITRGRIISEAMNLIGYQSETKIPKREGMDRTFLMEEILAESTRILFIKNVIERSLYSSEQVLSRYFGGFRMSESMRKDTSRLMADAQGEASTDENMAAALKILNWERDHNLHFVEKRSQNSNMEVLVIDAVAMPSQIGTCRVELDCNKQE